MVGVFVGNIDGTVVGSKIGELDGDIVGDSVGHVDGLAVCTIDPLQVMPVILQGICI